MEIVTTSSQENAMLPIFYKSLEKSKIDDCEQKLKQDTFT
jgi:hypothetical protein